MGMDRRSWSSGAVLSGPSKNIMVLMLINILISVVGFENPEPSPPGNHIQRDHQRRHSRYEDPECTYRNVWVQLTGPDSSGVVTFI